MTKYQTLITYATERMKHSRDPIHDEAHVRRVVAVTENIANDLQLTDKEKQALVLAAWWHDVGRTVTKKSSLIIMLFLDDIISALMLWRETIRLGLFGSVVGMATRILFCKSAAIGPLCAQIFLRKRTRLMLNILKDADAIDLLNIDRIQLMQTIIDNHSSYTLWYRLIVWYGLNIKKFKLKTQAAYRYLLRIAEIFLAWMSQKHVYTWHVRHFGTLWTEKTRAGVLALKMSIERMPLSSNG